MAAKTSSEDNALDEVKPIVEAEKTEEKVISVRIPKKTTTETPVKPKLSEAPKEEVKEEPALEEKAENPKESEETKSEETAGEESKSGDSVSSFSLLDAEKETAGEDDTKLSDMEAKEEPKDPQESIKKWLDDDDTEEGEKLSSRSEERGSKKFFLIALVLVVLAGAIGGGIYYYQTKVGVATGETEMQAETTNLPTATPSPTEAPEEEVDLKDYKVQVLNGTGKGGEATAVSNLLIDAGFNTPDKSNAANYNFTDTIVQLKKDTPSAVFEAVKKALSKDYNVVLEEEELDLDNDYDVIVTFGSSAPEKEVTPTPKEEI